MLLIVSVSLRLFSTVILKVNNISIDTSRVFTSVLNVNKLYVAVRELRHESLIKKKETNIYVQYTYIII